MTKKIIFFFFVFVFSTNSLASNLIDQNFCFKVAKENYNYNIELIEVKIDKYKNWTENGIKIIIGNFRWTPAKYKKRFKAKIIVTYTNKKKCIFDARVRHNGNQKDHIKLIDNSNSIIQSLDVNLISGNIYGIKKFKLLLDNTRGVLEDEIFLTSLLRKLNYLAPRSMYLNVNLNGSFLKMLFQENATNEMLKYNKRKIGPIFRGDERFFFKLAEKLPDNNESNESLGMIPLLEDTLRAMLIKQHNSEIIFENEDFLKISKNSYSNLSLIYLFYTNIFKDKKNDFRYFDYTLNNELLAFYQDERTLELDIYNLILNSTNSLHSLSINNRKFYWNNKENYFEPINYDNNVNFSKEPNLMIFPLTKFTDKAFLHLDNLLKNIDIEALNKEINSYGIKQNIKTSKDKLNLIKKNLSTIKNIYINIDKDLLTYNYNKKVDKKMWNSFFKALNKINKDIRVVRNTKKEFQVCDLALNCKKRKFSTQDIEKLLNGDMIIDNIEYQYIGNEFEDNELVKNYVE